MRMSNVSHFVYDADVHCVHCAVEQFSDAVMDNDSELEDSDDEEPLPKYQPDASRVVD